MRSRQRQKEGEVNRTWVQDGSRGCSCSKLSDKEVWLPKSQLLEAKGTMSKEDSGQIAIPIWVVLARTVVN